MNFDSYFKSSVRKLISKKTLPTQQLLRKSIFYTLFTKASRFRPQLCFATAKYFQQTPKKILPWAIAIEMVHSASLIHDDLPCMDNSSLRRGKKSNHLLFGEDIALLAGTSLFIESFSFLTDKIFKAKSEEILNLFISKVGFHGIMSGQALDLKLSQATKTESLKMLQLKTGSLIEASVLGPLLLWGKTKEEKQALKSFSKNLGIAYQLADDFIDQEGFFKPACPKELKFFTNKSLKALKPLGDKAKDLEALSLQNLYRIEKRT